MNQPRVCTCQITEHNRFDSTTCPRHHTHGGLLTDIAWDEITGNTQELGERR